MSLRNRIARVEGRQDGALIALVLVPDVADPEGMAIDFARHRGWPEPVAIGLPAHNSPDARTYVEIATDAGLEAPELVVADYGFDGWIGVIEALAERRAQ